MKRAVQKVSRSDPARQADKLSIPITRICLKEENIKFSKHLPGTSVVLSETHDTTIMEENTSNSTKTRTETDYSAHEENPGPAKTAVQEKDDKKVGYTIHWVIIIALILLALAYFLFV